MSIELKTELGKLLYGCPHPIQVGRLKCTSCNSGSIIKSTTLKMALEHCIQNWSKQDEVRRVINYQYALGQQIPRVQDVFDRILAIQPAFKAPNCQEVEMKTAKSKSDTVSMERIGDHQIVFRFQEENAELNALGFLKVNETSIYAAIACKKGCNFIKNLCDLKEEVDLYLIEPDKFSSFVIKILSRKYLPLKKEEALKKFIKQKCIAKNYGYMITNSIDTEHIAYVRDYARKNEMFAIDVYEVLSCALPQSDLTKVSRDNANQSSKDICDQDVYTEDRESLFNESAVNGQQQYGTFSEIDRPKNPLASYFTRFSERDIPLPFLSFLDSDLFLAAALSCMPEETTI